MVEWGQGETRKIFSSLLPFCWLCEPPPKRKGIGVVGVFFIWGIDKGEKWCYNMEKSCRGSEAKPRIGCIAATFPFLEHWRNWLALSAHNRTVQGSSP